MGKIAVILNPHAKENARNPSRTARLSKILSDNGEIFETMHTEELEAVCRRLPRNDTRIIGICGGDGTNHLVLTALMKSYRESDRPLPRLLFLRGGSMNTICNNLEIRHSAEESLKLLVSRVKSNMPFATFHQPTLDVNGTYGSILTVGYAYNFLKEYYGSGLKPGPMRAAKVVLNAIGSTVSGGPMGKRLAGKFQAEVLADGTRLSFGQIGMILAGTVEGVGVGFRPLSRAREDKKRFHALITSLSGYQILNQLHRFFLGKPFIGENNFDNVVSELVVRGKEPVGYSVDGEMYSDCKEIVVKAGPIIEVVLQP